MHPSKKQVSIRDRLGLLIAWLCVGAVSFWFMGSVPLNGDENSYVYGAKGLAEEILSLFEKNSSEPLGLQTALVQRGWFMPAISIILSPLFIVFGPDAPFYLVRAYMLTLNIILLYAISIQLLRRLSTRSAWVFVLCCACVPYYVSFLSTAWSELVAIHIAILFLLRLDKLIVAGELISSSSAAYAIAFLSYIRALYPSYLLVIVTTWILTSLGKGDSLGRSLKMSWKKFWPMFFIFVGIMSPWMISVSELYGPNYLITSKRMKPLISNGEQDYIEKARSATGRRNPYLAVHDYVDARAKKNDRTFREQMELDKERYVKPTEKPLRRIARNIHHYFAVEDSTNFITRFMRLRCNRSDDCLDSSLAGLIKKINNTTWKIVATLGLVMFMIPLRALPGHSFFMPFLWKAAVCIVAVVPLLGTTHGRYYAQFIPLVGVGASYFVQGRFEVIRFGKQLIGTPVACLVTVGQILSLFFALFYIVLLVLF